MGDCVKKSLRLLSSTSSYSGMQLFRDYKAATSAVAVVRPVEEGTSVGCGGGFSNR
jgi:hypothetical protein